MKNLFLILLFLPLFVQGQIITTIAGNGIQGYTGDGGPSDSSELFNPVFTKINDSGYLFFSDFHNNVIRKISPSGIISTFAGNGTIGFSGDSGLATSAQLYAPGGVAFDKYGNVYIADWWNNRIRKVNALGIITTIAGNGIQGYTGDGGPAINAELYFPTNLALDTLGNLYISDRYNNVIRKIDQSGIITTFAGNGYGAGLGYGGYAGDGGPADSAEFHFPFDLCFDASGNLYVADAANNVVRKINTSGIITTIAGNGSGIYSGDNVLATAAAICVPSAICIDDTGNLLIADYSDNRIRKVNTAGIITTIAGTGIAGFSGDNGLATEAELFSPEGVSTDHSGNVYVAEPYNVRIRRIGGWPTGINQLSTPSQTISIFPNPATTSLTIQSSAQPITQIIITNLLGQTVYMQATPASSTQQIDVSAFPPGMYFVKINDSEVRKFVKE